MRKWFFLSLSLLCFNVLVVAQVLTIFSTGKSYNDKLYGLKNRQGAVVVPAQYEELFWMEGLYQARVNYRFFLLDSTGQLLSKEGYNWVSFPVNGDKSKGLIMAKKGDRFGYLTRKAEVAIPFELEQASAFSWGFAIVKRFGKFGVINTSGKLIIPHEYDKIEAMGSKYFFAVRNGKSHLLKSSGEIVMITALYDRVFPPVSNCLLIMKDNKYGVIDMAGKEILPISFSHISIESSSFIFAEDGVSQFGYSAAGKLLFKQRYEGHKTSNFIHPIAFKKNGLWGFYDTLGNVPLQPQFDDFDVITPFIIKVKKNNKYGVVNSAGYYIMPVKYTLIELGYRDLGAGIVKNELYYGLISGYGVEITDLKYGFIGQLDGSLDVQLTFIAQNDQLERSMNSDAKPMLKSDDPVQKQRIWELLKENYSANYQPISEGMIPVLLENKWGFIDNRGKVVIPFEYDLVTHFQNGRAEVLKGKNRFYIDKSGKKL